MRNLRLLFTSGALLCALGLPSLAAAAEASCQNENGSCSVSNEPFDWLECSCQSGDGGGTGGNNWQGLDNAGMMEVCLEELAFCSVEPGTTTEGPQDTGGETTTASNSETGTGTGENTGATTGANSETGAGTGDTTGTSSGTDGSTGGGSSEGGSAEGGSAEGGSAEGGSAEGGSAEGGSTAGANEGGGGCSIGQADPSSLAIVLLGMLGLRCSRRRKAA